MTTTAPVTSYARGTADPTGNSIFGPRHATWSPTRSCLLSAIPTPSV